jgi:hypothetical protein
MTPFSESMPWIDYQAFQAFLLQPASASGQDIKASCPGFRALI